MNTHPLIAIVGAGAVGGYYGARLAQHGHDVHFLLRGDYEAVRDAGWTVESCDGDFTLPPGRVRAYADARGMPPADLVIVTLKTTSNDRLQGLVEPLVKDATVLLTLQNGLGNEERLAAAFGDERVLGGIAFTCINRVGPGQLRHTSHGHIRIGEYGRAPGARVASLSELFNGSGIRCRVLDDLRRGRWEKLVWNIPFNGLGAVLDWTTDRILATAPGAGLVASLMEEVMSAARAMGMEMPTDMVRRQIDSTREMGAYATSMQVDRQEGRPMEVEAILGEPLRQARAAGVSMLHLANLYELARMVDPA